MRILGWIVVIVLVVVGLLAGVGWYVVHNASNYVPQIVANLEKRTGLKVQISHIQVRLRPALMVTVFGLEVKNPKPFPSGDVLNVPRLDANVKEIPLIHGNVEIRSLLLEHPVIDLISDPDGLWNFQNPSTKKSTPARFSMGVIEALQIEHGTLLESNLIDPKDTPGPVVLTVHDFSARLRQIDFRSSKSAQIIHGSLKASTARFGDIHLRDVQSQLRISPRHLRFKDFDAKTHSGHARGDFTFHVENKIPKFDTVLHVSGIGMPYLLAEFSQGPPKMTGTMEADFKLGGEIKHTTNPLNEVRGTGTFTIRNGELPSLNADKSMAQMKRFRDPAAKALPASAFSTFAGDMDVDHQRISSRRIGVNFYGIDIDGAGSTLTTVGAMDYRGLATIQQKQGFLTDLLASWFKGAKIKNGRMTFTLHLTGTLAKPKFVVK